VLQVTRALAAEWAKDGINVNAVGPTLIHTDLTHELFEDQEYIDKFMQYIPAGELPKPANVADVVVFLASPASDFVHGHLIPVDSGELIR
jgi:2-deoxy-D-gluconate 3-dehydrogenase